MVVSCAGDAWLTSIVNFFILSMLFLYHSMLFFLWMGYFCTIQCCSFYGWIRNKKWSEASSANLAQLGFFSFALKPSSNT